MAYLYNTLIFQPFYNGFIFLMNIFPFFDAGVIIVIFTIIIKIIILPLSIKASKAQMEMKSTEKDLQLIKEKYKDRNEQSRKTMEYYKERGINPFAGIFVLIIQLPILIGLYQVFIKSGLPNISGPLYSSLSSWVSVVPNMMFLGLIDISQRSIVLALIAGITTYFQISHASKTQPQGAGTGTQADLAKAMAVQMKYFFPVLMTFIAYTISSAVAIYFITSNLFAIVQEIYIRKKYHKDVTVI